MDVYLVPLGADRHELYCEVPDDDPEVMPQEDADEPTGRLRWLRPRVVIRRLRQRFREMLAEAERERRHSHTSPSPSGWFGRVKARTMRWVAESIAEQRLLWHLRQQESACLYYPDDLQESQAVGLLRGSLNKDFEKHRFWLIIDSLGFIASGALMLVPGPNLLAYYFAFRLVGHYFSLRGAKQGLMVIQWRHEASALLTELRRVAALAPDVREERVHDVASRLRLEHLPSFFQRAAVPS
jgi:Mitochondrial K+-H+ exchange-related